jgi:hypothetical protein
VATPQPALAAMKRAAARVRPRPTGKGSSIRGRERHAPRRRDGRLLIQTWRNFVQQQAGNSARILLILLLGGSSSFGTVYSDAPGTVKLLDYTRLYLILA